jgi:hypothetical protein
VSNKKIAYQQGKNTNGPVLAKKPVATGECAFFSVRPPRESPANFTGRLHDGAYTYDPKPATASELFPHENFVATALALRGNPRSKKMPSLWGKRRAALSVVPRARRRKSQNKFHRRAPERAKSARWCKSFSDRKKITARCAGERRKHGEIPRD